MSPIQYIPFEDWRPDTSINTMGLRLVVNAHPRPNGWGPAYKAIAQADLGQIDGSNTNYRGRFSCRELDSSGDFVRAIYIAAGDGVAGAPDAILSRLAIDTPQGDVDRLVGGAYSSSDNAWDFCRFGNNIIACNGVNTVQFYDHSTVAVTFEDLVTSTYNPHARFCTTSGQHLILGGASGEPNRFFWSARDDASDFDPSETTLAGWLDLKADAGEIMGLEGFEDYFLIFTDLRVYRCQHTGGVPLWDVHEIGSIGDGCVAPESIVKSGVDVFYFSRGGFKQVINGETVVPIDTGLNQELLYAGSAADFLTTPLTGGISITTTNLGWYRIPDYRIWGAGGVNSSIVSWRYGQPTDASTVDSAPSDDAIILQYDKDLDRWGLQYVDDLSRYGPLVSYEDDILPYRSRYDGDDIAYVELDRVHAVALSPTARAASFLTGRFSLFPGQTEVHRVRVVGTGATTITVRGYLTPDQNAAVHVVNAVTGENQEGWAIDGFPLVAPYIEIEVHYAEATAHSVWNVIHGIDVDVSGEGEYR